MPTDASLLDNYTPDRWSFSCLDPRKAFPKKYSFKLVIAILAKWIICKVLEIWDYKSVSWSVCVEMWHYLLIFIFSVISISYYFYFLLILFLQFYIISVSYYFYFVFLFSFRYFFSITFIFFIFRYFNFFFQFSVTSIFLIFFSIFCYFLSFHFFCFL